MKNSFKEICLRVLLLFVGLTIAHFGVTLFLLTDLGSDPFNVLVQGIFRTSKALLHLSTLTYGHTHMTICFLIILILLATDRSYIKIGTILCMICGGPIIDFFTWMLKDIINSGNPFVMRLIILAAGCVILAFGMTIVIKSDVGTGPNDLVAIVISDKLHAPFGRTRIIVDICFVLLGYILGGVVGIGTIIAACLIGPIAGIFLPYNGKLVDYIIRKFKSKTPPPSNGASNLQRPKGRGI